MKTYRMVVGLMMVSVTAVVCAANRTWDGGGADANWNTVNNWDGDLTAPVADDALYFGGSTGLANTNDLLATDPSFAGLTFNSGAGAFTLWGSRITLGGNVTNRSSNTQTLNLPMILSGTRTFYGSNAAITVNGVLSGAGGLTANLTNSPLTLTADNTYTGATALKAGSRLIITHSNALGSTNGTTTAEDGSWIEMSGGINVPESIALYGDASTSYSGVLRSKGGSNIISGVILNGSRIKSNSGSLDLIGGVKGGQLVLGADPGTFIRVSEKPISIGGNQIFAHTGALIIFAVTNNSWGNMEVSGNYVRTDAENALATASTLTVSSGDPSGVNLNGFNQTIGQLIGTATTAGTRKIYSDTPATLTVNQSATSTYGAAIAGMANFVKAGSGTITFTNMLSTTTGSIIVSNGTVVVENTAGFSGSTNVVVAGGTLELRIATSLSDSAVLSIAAGGAKVKIGTGLVETVSRLVLGGVPQARGTYGSSTSGALYTNDTFFSGSGQLNVANNPLVTAVDATWDAGGAPDTFVSTAANWNNDTRPAFDGTTRAIFATGGNTATVDTAVGLYGITFNGNTNFTLAAGAGVVSNAIGGILASAPTTISRTYTLAEDVILTDNQTWSVTTNTPGVTTLNVTGAIDDGLVPCNITKMGDGTLTLSASNTFDGAVVVSNGILRVMNANALGSTNGNTTIQGVYGGRLYLNGNLNLAEPLVLNGEKNNGGTLNNEGGSNTLSGPITCYNQVRLVVYTGTLVVSGGVYQADGNVGGSLVINSGTTTYFNTKPLNLGLKTFYTDSGGLTVLGVSGNTWADMMVASGTLRCDVPNALPATASLRLGIGYGPNGTLNLNGNNQTIGKLYLAITNAGQRVITSPTPALLTVNQTENTLCDVQFTGAVSLLKTGIGSLTLTNAATSTSGSFTVSNGTLVVSSTGTFGNNSTNIVVGGTGTLTLSNSVSIANNATVRLPATGTATAKINLAAGVNEAVGYLFFSGVQKRASTYGATGSGAQVIDAEHFAGTGILTVLHDKSGTLFRVQ